MVRVKTPTGFKEVKLGQTIRGVTVPSQTTQRSGTARTPRVPTTTTKDKKVTIKGTEVFINGLGFSVAPELQAEFIRQETGGKGRSAKQAIAKAETIAAESLPMSTLMTPTAAATKPLTRAELAAKTRNGDKVTTSKFQQLLEKRQPQTIQELIAAGGSVPLPDKPDKTIIDKFTTFVSDVKQDLALSKAEKDKKIEQGRKDIASFYREQGFEVPEGFRAGALTTGAVTTKEKEEFKEHVGEIDKRADEIETFFSRKRDILFTQKARGQEPSISTELLGGIGAGAVIGGIEAGRGIAQVVLHPIQTIKDLPETTKQAIQSASGLGGVIRQEPGFVAGVLLSNIALDLAAGKGFQKVVGVADNAITRADPRFREVVETDTGLVIKDIPTPEGNKIDIPLLQKGDTIGIDLTEQAKIAGKVENPVSSARDFISTFQKTREVQKPIPKEELLTPETRKLLDKFDTGNVKGLDIIDLDARIKRETGAKGLLERAFFADPKGRLRVSRFGFQQQKGATLIDILAGDVTFRKPKAQALLFSDEVIAKFPKELKTIEKKLLEGKELTKTEKNKLLKFQLTPSGEFKPIGFLGPEPEVTLAPGEIIKAKRKAALTFIDGNKVAVYSAKIEQATPGTRLLLNKLKNGIITDKELAKLKTRFKSETGLDLSSFVKDFKPFVSPLTPGVATFSAAGKLAKPFSSSAKPLSTKGSISPKIKASSLKSPSPTSSTVSLKSPTLTTSTTTKITTAPSIIKSPTPKLKSPSPGISKASPPSKISSPTKLSPPVKSPVPTKPLAGIIPDRLLTKKIPGRKPRPQPGWLPQIKVKGKYKTYTKPFKTQRQAEAFGQWAVDHSLDATYRLMKVKNVKSYSKKLVPQPSQLKFRKFKRVRGREVPLANFGGIEKRRYRLDKKSEVKKIQTAKLIAQRFPKKKTQVKAPVKLLIKSPQLRAPPRLLKKRLKKTK